MSARPSAWCSTNCKEMPGQVLDIASPLTTPLGTPDPTYVSQTNPGIGHGLDGSPDLMFVNTIQATSDVEASPRPNGAGNFRRLTFG
jgi:hypothetical protein